jgi:hypothetical protein
LFSPVRSLTLSRAIDAARMTPPDAFESSEHMT